MLVRRRLRLVFLVFIFAAIFFLLYNYNQRQYFTKNGAPSQCSTSNHVPDKLAKNQGDVNDDSSSIGDSSVLYYNPTFHHVIDGRVFLNDASNTKDLRPKERAERGFSAMKKMRVAFAGTVRNCVGILRSMRPRYEALARLFKDSHFFFVENDSKDGTRGFLLEWAKEASWKDKVHVLGCGGVNLPSCHVDFASASHVPGGKLENPDFNKRRNRVDIMAQLRNIYLNRILAAENPFDLILVIDYDLMASFSMAGVARSVLHLQRPFVDAVCANARGSSLSYFWDACTIVYPPMSKYDPFLQPWELVVWKSVISSAIPREPGKWRPQKVVSCFQGFTIYRTESLKKYGAIYKGPPPGYHTCEHNMLAYQLKNLYVEPSFDFHVTINHSEG